MRAVRSRNTTPEKTVRKLLGSLGKTGYRLHRKELPGKPDVVYISRKKAIFIHGCFWHGHDCKRGKRKPVTNADYWSGKIERNQERDSMHIIALKQMDWTVLIIWECELRDLASLSEKLIAFI
ncbi:MAG: hypothetical protein ACD_51C00164G0001 [uncultured bacterium]|nr:MAG: hypothetical protein ACD_51C00164G0001 [uncultured bacterium]